MEKRKRENLFVFPHGLMQNLTRVKTDLDVEDFAAVAAPFWRENSAALRWKHFREVSSFLGRAKK